MLKRGLLFLLVFIIFLQNSLAQECLVASEENVPIIARNILQTYSQLDLHGITHQQAAIDSLDRWQPENVDPNWMAFKEEIKEEIIKLSGTNQDSTETITLTGTENIRLCNPEENIPLVYCSTNSDRCSNGYTQSFTSMESCLKEMRSQLGNKQFLYQPSSESQPKCSDIDTFILRILDDSGNIYKPYLEEINIEVFNDLQSCQVGVASRTFYICNPDSVDSRHYCTHDPDQCIYYYTKIMTGTREQCEEEAKFKDNLLGEYGSNLCRTDFGIYYIPTNLFYGTSECDEGDEVVTKLLHSLNSQVVETLNDKDYFLCGNRLKNCFEGNEGELAIAYRFNSLDLCSDRFETEKECNSKNGELSELYDYDICYNEGKNKLECKNRGQCHNILEGGPFSESECNQRINEIENNYVFKCQISQQEGREDICSNNFEDCSHEKYISIYSNLQSCYQSMTQLSLVDYSYLFQDERMWRCVYDSACIENIPLEGLRYFSGGKLCYETASSLNEGEWVLYHSGSNGVYECTGDLTKFASECNPQITGLYSDLNTCFSEATILNQNSGYNWYLCSPNEDNQNYYCAENMNDCYYDIEDESYPLDYAGVFATEESCREIENRFNSNRWQLCHNKGDYNCQLGLENCGELTNSFSDFWTCTSEIERLQPTLDDSTDVLFIPVNWRGSFEDYRFYAESQTQVLLETARLSNLDISSFNLQVHYVDDLELCTVPYMQSSNIDNRIIDCINRAGDLGFEFNPIKDKIIALTDDDMGNVLGFTSSYFPYLNIVKYVSKGTLAHELGHSALNLCDEYDYDDWNRQNEDRSCPNPYPTCCFDHPDNKENRGFNCYPEGTSSEYTEDSLCQGAICDPTESQFCRSIMGPGRSLRILRDVYKNSLELKYLTWKLDQRGEESAE
ncbi:MAG: hypothetical protein Q8Q35_01220 [Nanoarchaeota archaeon]|nr:hypothetical protein [Nanoarchaeota archaeon]